MQVRLTKAAVIIVALPGGVNRDDWNLYPPHQVGSYVIENTISRQLCAVKL